MAICPICNGLETIEFQCERCSQKMEDLGKISDYFDDYSPYMEIDWMRLEDGFPAITAKVNVFIFFIAHIVKMNRCI